MMRRALIVVAVVVASWAMAPPSGQIPVPAAVYAQPQDRPEIARVNDDGISNEAFESRYVDYLLRTGTHDTPRLRRAVLEQMVNEHLMVSAAKKNGAALSDAFRQQRELARKKLMIEWFLEKEVLASVEVTPAEMEAAFLRINTEIDARHLFAKTKDEADVLRTRLSEGESFEDLAREVFIEPTLANNGGSVGTFTFDEMDADFEDAAFALSVGEISEPVRTAHGYSIIQVVDRFTKPILTEHEYAQRKDKLATLVLRKMRAQTRSHYARTRIDELAPAYRPALGILLAQITGMAILPDEQLDAFLNEELVNFGPKEHRTTWMIKDFRDRAAETDPAQRAQVRSKVELENFIDGLILREDMIGSAQRRGAASDPEFQAALDGAMDQWMFKSAKAELAARVHIPEDSVRAYFKRHPNEFVDEQGDPLAYAEVRGRIEQQMHLVTVQTRMLEHFAELRRAADIIIRDDVLRSVEIAGRSFEITSAAP